MLADRQVDRTVLLHDPAARLDHDLGDWTNKDLALPTLLSVVDALKSVAQHAATLTILQAGLSLYVVSTGPED